VDNYGQVPVWGPQLVRSTVPARRVAEATRGPNPSRRGRSARAEENPKAVRRAGRGWLGGDVAAADWPRLRRRRGPRRNGERRQHAASKSPARPDRNRGSDLSPEERLRRPGALRCGERWCGQGVARRVAPANGRSGNRGAVTGGATTGCAGDAMARGLASGDRLKQHESRQVSDPHALPRGPPGRCGWRLVGLVAGCRGLGGEPASPFSACGITTSSWVGGCSASPGLWFLRG
jgi:hypothetical protein